MTGIISKDSTRPAPTGNAIVPEDAPIMPYQLFVFKIAEVTDVASFVEATGAFVGLDYSALGMTHLNSAYVPYFGELGLAFVGGSLADNSLPTADIDVLLNVMAGAPGTLPLTTTNLSGTDMGVPTPVQPRVNGYALFQCASYPNDADTLEVIPIDFSYTYFVVFDASVDFADSGTAGFEIVGIQDTPTLAQINTYLETFAGLVGGVIEATADSKLPLTNNSAASLLAEFTAGQPFMLNADIDAITINGGTVIVMEYENRIGPQVEVSGSGVPEINNTYTLGGKWNDKSYYSLGASYSFSAIAWNGTYWYISDAGGYEIYTSLDDTAEPWDAVFTSVDLGDNPPPTLAFTGDLTKEIVTYTP